MEYDYQKIEADLEDVRSKLKTEPSFDKIRELTEKRQWLESKLKARDLGIATKHDS